jgi:TRAP-type C4-dicarboxylate transport system permease small subunit
MTGGASLGCLIVLVQAYYCSKLAAAHRSPGRPLYLATPNQIGDAIGRGELTAGTCLPTQGDVAARLPAAALRLGVSLAHRLSVDPEPERNVIGRFVFAQGIYFTEELNQFLIVLVTFVGVSYVARKGRHIRMSAFYDQLSERGRKVMTVLAAAVTAAVLFVLAYHFFEYVMRVAKLGRVTPSLQVSLSLTYIWVPLALIVTGIQYVLTVVKNLQADGGLHRLRAHRCL